MTIEYIKTNNNTYHISIYNYENKFCYWVSILQRLHTSPTLNNLVLNDPTIDINNEDINSQLMLPVKIYASLDADMDSDMSLNSEDNSTENDTDENTDENITGGPNAGKILNIYTKLKNYFNDFIPKYIHHNALNGYVPRFLLVYFYCPIIHKLYPNQFIDIINEIHINKNEFDVSPTVAVDIIKSANPFLIDELNDQIVIQYQTMMKTIKSINSVSLVPFTSATLEVFPNKDKTGGHAITLLYGSSNIEPTINTYYIIDDQRTISRFGDYYRNRNERIYEISIRDINDVIAAELNKILHEESGISPNCKFSARITQYILCFEHNFLTPTDDILRHELRQQDISTSVSNSPLQLLNDTPIYRNSTIKQIQTIALKWFLLGLIIGSIIGVILELAHNKYHNTYGPHQLIISNN